MFVDDDPKAGKLWLRFFRNTPYQCLVYQDPRKALERHRDQGADLIITDLRMPGMSGTQLLKAIRGIDQQVPVILITAFADLDSAIESLRLGATDFIKKPYDMNKLLGLVDKALKPAQQAPDGEDAPRPWEGDLHYGMVGESDSMRRLYRMIEKLADVQCNIIIQGESGTGKELAARAIHKHGQRAQDPFVVIDCGSITDTLLESELFGHCRGAFTGADRERQGLLQVAGKGTVFLDEIGNISDAMQVKLLRVLQEGTFTPVGDSSSVTTQARFIAATHQDLHAMVGEGRFRDDLYHRLNVVTVTMPSLGERREDIPALIRHFSLQFAETYQRPLKEFSSAKIHQLCRRPWGGNIRELRNYVERAFIMSEGSRLDMDDETRVAAGAPKGKQPSCEEPESGRGDQDLDRLEQQHIRQVLASVGGNQSRAAELLGIHRSTLWRKLRQAQEKEG